MNEDKSVHELSGLEYTEKSDFGQSPILVIEQRRHVPAIRVFTDKQGEFFVMLYGVAGNCGFSSWTNKPFVEAIRRLGVEVYRNTDNGAFAVKVIDVVTIAEELLTLPRKESLMTVDNAFINITNEFFDWWNSKALAAIEKQAHRKLIPEPTRPAEVITDHENGTTVSTTGDNTDPVICGFPYNKIDLLVLELDRLIYQINALVDAGLSRNIAIRTAINLRENFWKNDKESVLRNYTAIEKIVEVFNPRAVAIKLNLDLEESGNE
ncbi:MAG: hypothetical protein J5809_02715 [Selenomonadaceae bacterium]|nr:hypothetical protein [Selenomonadaceae bacterium]